MSSVVAHLGLRRQSRAATALFERAMHDRFQNAWPAQKRRRVGLAAAVQIVEARPQIS